MTTPKSTIYIRDKVYVPTKHLDLDSVREHYTIRMYDENACQRCEYRPDRHSYLCDTCEAFTSVTKLYSRKEVRGVAYIGLPIGDKKNFTRVTGLSYSDFRIKDIRQQAPFTKKIKFLATLRDYQEPLVSKFMDQKFGLIEAPPRTGKCLTGSTLVYTNKGVVDLKSLTSVEQGDDEYRDLNLVVKTARGISHTSHSYKQKVYHTIKVVTEKGFDVQGTPDHPLLVLTPLLKLVWRKLRHLEEGDVLCLQRSTPLWATDDFVVPRLGKLTPEIARLMGYLVANGSLAAHLKRLDDSTVCENQNARFYSRNKKVQEDFINCVRKVCSRRVQFSTIDNFSDNAVPSVVTPKSLVLILQTFGLKFTVSKFESIPQSVLSSTEPIVRSFLEAYLSCDSYYQQGHAIQLSTASAKLAHQLQVVLLNYGIVASRTSYWGWARNSNTPVKRIYWDMKIRSAESRDLMLSTFKILKDTKIDATVDIRSHDVIPYAGSLLRQAFFEHHQGSGVYLIKGKRKMLSRLCLYSRKVGMESLFIDGYIARRDLHTINFESFSALDETSASRLAKASSSKFYFERVSNVKHINKPTWVYDIAVPEGKNFVANGIVSHNTLVMLNLCLQLGQRALILADQHEFLKQFEYHITGDEKSGTPKCTNLPELEDRCGKKLFGFPKTDADYENFQFFLMPYQQFFNTKTGRERFKKLLPHIGTVAVDEVHSAAATQFSQILSKFPSLYKFGVTATVSRKDGRHKILKKVLGPVVARSHREALTPVVYLHETQFVPKSAYNQGRRSWVFAMQALAKDKKRNELVVEQVIRDLKMGHNIVIPVSFRKHVTELRERINKEWGSVICEEFTGGACVKNKELREDILNRVKCSKTRVIVGIRRILQRGLNVPQWSAIYEITPISNKPNLMQETSRIRTSLEGKCTPIIRLFVDFDLGQSVGCARNTVNHMKEFKYKFSDNKAQAKLVLKLLGTGRRRNSDVDEVDENFKAVKANIGQSGLFGQSTKKRL